MTTGILTDRGEEWLLKTDISAVSSVTVGLYNDGTGASASDPDDTTDLTDPEDPTNDQPNGGSYADVSANITTASLGGNWGFDNDAQLSFDVSDSTNTVNAYYILATTTNLTGDATGGTQHLMATGALSQSRDLSQITTLNIAAGANNGTAGVGFTVN